MPLRALKLSAFGLATPRPRAKTARISRCGCRGPERLGYELGRRPIRLGGGAAEHGRERVGDLAIGDRVVGEMDDLVADRFGELRLGRQAPISSGVVR